MFYGGYVRSSNETMFVHVLSYMADQNNLPVAVPAGMSFNGWIGVSFSELHASRDMIAFITSNGTVMDLFSLFYDAPYQDDSTNIQGTSNILSVANSQSYITNSDTTTIMVVLDTPLVLFSCILLHTAVLLSPYE